MLGVRKNSRKPPESSDEEDDDEEVGSDEGSVNAMEEDADDAGHGNDDENADDADLEGNTTTAFRAHNTLQDSYHHNWIFKNSSATPSPHIQRPLTIAEKISNLIQVNMEGVPGKCHIFETTFSTDYQGSDSGTLAGRGNPVHSAELFGGSD